MSDDWANIHAAARHAEARLALVEPEAPPKGGDLLDRIATYLGRFVSFPSPHALTAHALWIAHTHAMDAWESTPRIAFLSPEPGSGKTRALEVTQTLVPNPVEAVNVTSAYLFRKVGDQAGRPTILFDEIDTVFGPKAKDNEEMRGLLNAGHRRGAVAGRCVVRGKLIETEELPAYCAVALAGLGGLPDTILSRSVIIRMRRRAPDEFVEAYRSRVHEPEGHALREALVAWIKPLEPTLAYTVPEMPPGIDDRDADVWEALLAVADAAGGDWPRRARVAAVALVAASKEDTPSLGVRLLDDIRTIFHEGGEDVISTENVAAKLIELEDSSWGDLKGKALDSRALARRLKPYGITPRTVRIGDKTPKGYRREDFHDAWKRYLRPASDKSATSATSATSRVERVASDLFADDRTGGPCRPGDEGWRGRPMPPPEVPIFSSPGRSTPKDSKL